MSVVSPSSTRRHRVAGIVLGSVTAGLLLFGSSPAVAVDTPWYQSALKLDAGAAEGFTGEGVTIAVIDGQINTEVAALAGADITVREPSFCFDEGGSPMPATTTELSETRPTDHGTNVVSMIVGSGEQSSIAGVAPGATINYYSVYTAEDAEGSLSCLDEEGRENSPFGAAFTEAVADGADIISVSLSETAGSDFRLAASQALRDGVVIFGSLANSSELELRGGMPGAANGAIGVQAAGADGEIQSTDGVPNRNARTTVVAPGLGFTLQGNRATGSWEEPFQADGTSLATPLAAGVMALAMEKYPSATGNQLIQSLIRNTGGTGGDEATYDPEELYGYGLISVENLMAADPTGYEDVNPLIKKDGTTQLALVPSYDEIFNPAAATEAPADPSDDPSSEAPEPSDGIPVWVWALLAVVVGVVLVAVVVIVLVVRKRNSAPRSSH